MNTLYSMVFFLSYQWVEEPVFSPFNQQAWGFLLPAAWKWGSPVGVQKPDFKVPRASVLALWSLEAPMEEALVRFLKIRSHGNPNKIKQHDQSREQHHPALTYPFPPANRLIWMNAPPSPERPAQTSSHCLSKACWITDSRAKDILVALTRSTFKVVCFLTTDSHNVQNYFRTNLKSVSIQSRYFCVLKNGYHSCL